MPLVRESVRVAKYVSFYDCLPVLFASFIDLLILIPSSNIPREQYLFSLKSIFILRLITIISFSPAESLKSADKSMLRP